MIDQSYNVWKLFPTCHMVKGAARGVIIDIQRGSYFTVPLSMIELIEEYQDKSIASVLDQFDSEDQEILKEYFAFLIENELIFEYNEVLKDNFVNINTSFNYPAIINNAIIDFDSFSLTRTQDIAEQLCDLLCYNWVLKLNFIISAIELDQLLEVLNFYEPHDVCLILSNEIKFDIKRLKSKYNFITSIIFSNARKDIDTQDLETNTRIVYSSKNFLDCKSCGVVNQFYFTLSMNHFTESLSHNTCLNRKIAIDAEGNIKNCPSMKQTFGNIKNTTLKDVIKTIEFKKYWDITKDQVAKCKDCEFRNICTDCRAYVENPDDIYSAPLKCGYDPYNCEWEEWSTHPLKQQAIDHYDLRKML